ncbi:MAG: tRNA pseudouridine(38-40) synthase TruA [Armatimonadota bacterium]
MRNVRLVVQYDGTDYAGFQTQLGCPTIQMTLQKALSSLLAEDVRVCGASRTDAGVHALGQVVSFTTENVIPVERLLRALNALLPRDIACVAAQEVSAEFHPRFNARSKRYSYRIRNHELPSPFGSRYSWHLCQPLDIPAMGEAGSHLVGRHDFAAFRAAGGSAKTSVREISLVEVTNREDFIEVLVEGNGFLYMMVRIIVGTLVEVGLGRIPPRRVSEILASKDRGQAGDTAPPQGLTLVRIDY